MHDSEKSSIFTLQFSQSFKNAEKIKKVWQDMTDAKAEITSAKLLSLDVDGVLLDYFYTETDTLLTVLDLARDGHYKECFILLRTVFEEFLY